MVGFGEVFEVMFCYKCVELNNIFLGLSIEIVDGFNHVGRRCRAGV